MIRDIEIHEQKAVNAMFKAGANMKTGVAVVKDYTNGLAVFPAANAVENIFFADREREKTGVYAAQAVMSDYDSHFTTIVNGTFVKLRQYGATERFAIDAFNSQAAPNAGAMLAFSATGQAITAPANTTSVYKCINNNYSDAGHRLMIIEVLQDGAANA